jgi:hypothetical protein
MLSVKRDASVAQRFFKKLMKAALRRLPFTISFSIHAPQLNVCDTNKPVTNKMYLFVKC